MLAFSKINVIISVSSFVLLLVLIIIFKNNSTRYPISNYYYSLELNGVILNKYEQPKLHNCFLISINQAGNVILELDLPSEGNDIYSYCNIGDSIRKQANSKSIKIVRNGITKKFPLLFIQSD